VDQELVEKIIAGDHRAFEVLYLQYGKKVFYVASRFGLSREDSEGIVQEVFIKIWERRADLRTDLSLNAYILTITKNIIIKKTRNNAFMLATKKYLSTHSDASHNNTEESLVYADLFNITESFLNELPEQQRVIFKMSKIEDLPSKEIAKQLNLSLRTVENHIFRASSKLKTKLKLLGIGTLSITIIYAFFHIY